MLKGNTGEGVPVCLNEFTRLGLQGQPVPDVDDD